MRYLTRHKWIVFSMFVSLILLIAYDLFNVVEKRGVVDDSRLLARVWRILILGFSICFFIATDTLKILKFNRKLILIYLCIIVHLLFYNQFSFDTLIYLSKILYLLFLYLFFFKFYSRYMNISTVRYLNLFITTSVLILSAHIIATRFGVFGSSNTIALYGDNNAYTLLPFYPLIYFIRQQKIRTILFTVLVLAICFSLKRGGILALFLCIIVSYFFETRILMKNNFLNKVIRVSITAIIVWGLFFIYSNFSHLFNERMLDLKEGGESFGSGRGSIYNLIWRDWLDSASIQTYFFGKGYNSVQNLTKLHTGSALTAHSDFLNFIHSYGLIGIGLLLAFLINQIKTIRKLFVVRNKLVIPYFSLFIIFFCKAIYSGNFEDPSFAYLLIGYAIVNASLSNLKTN
jgi:hypothetical protein